MRVDPSKTIPTSGDTAEQWVSFHKALKSWFGKQQANAYWLKFWNQRGGAGSDADTHDLRTYMETQDVNITTNLKGDITDGVLGVVDWFGDSVNMIRAIVFGGAIVGIGLIAYYVIKSTNNGKSAGQMIGDIPARRAPRLKPLKLLP